MQCRVDIRDGDVGVSVAAGLHLLRHFSEECLAWLDLVNEAEQKSLMGSGVPATGRLTGHVWRGLGTKWDGGNSWDMEVEVCVVSVCAWENKARDVLPWVWEHIA